MENIQTSIDNKIVVNTTSEDTSLEDILTYVSINIDSWTDKNIIWDLRNFNSDTSFSFFSLDFSRWCFNQSDMILKTVDAPEINKLDKKYI